MEIITIHTEYIQLDQLLKWHGLIETGGQIGFFMNQHAITINGSSCKEKRKKIYIGDRLEIQGVGIFQIEKGEN